MIRHGLVYYSFVPFVLLSAAQRPQYELVLYGDRIGDTITLRCRNERSGAFERLEESSPITFWLNNTHGVRTITERNLLLIPDLPDRRIVGESFSFRITPELEGLYECGSTLNESEMAQSNVLYLTCK